MEKAEVRTEAPVTVAGVTLIPVVKTRLDYWRSKGRFSYFGNRQPVGIVVISLQTRQAFRITGEEVTFDQLIKEVPDIEKVLAEL